MIKVFNGGRRGLGGEANELFLQLGFSFRDQLHHFKGARLAVFMAICLHSNREGVAWPSYSRLEDETGYDRAAIAQAIADLCEISIDGERVLCRWQEPDDKGRFVGSNKYRIFPSATEAAEADQLLQSRPKTAKARSEKQPIMQGGSLKSELPPSLKSELPPSLKSELPPSLKSELEEDPMLEEEPLKEKPGGDLVQDQPARQPAQLPPPLENQTNTITIPIVQDAPTPIVQAQPTPIIAPAPVTLPSQLSHLPSQQGVEELLRAATDRFAGVYHRNGEQARIDGVTKRAGAVGVDRPQFTALVDTYLKEKGLERVANGSSGYAGRALADAQEFVTDLITYDERFRKSTGIRVLFHSWAVNNPNLRDPSPSQLLGHASQMLEGKVKTIVSFRDGQFVTREASANGALKAELTFKQFLLRRYGADALTVVMDMTGKGEGALRAEYQTHLLKPAPVPAQ